MWKTSHTKVRQVLCTGCKNLKKTKMNFSFILIGSTHGFINDFLKQKEMIEEINPDFVLCEEMEDYILDSKNEFEKFLKEKKVSNMTSFSEVKELSQFCFNKKINLIGIDLKNFGFNFKLQNKIKSQGNLTSEENQELSKIIKKRENNHLRKIKEFSKKTKRPIIIILGCWHLRVNSLLRKKLTNYKIIAPCDEKENILISPKEDKMVKYCEIISNDKQD